MKTIERARPGQAPARMTLALAYFAAIESLADSVAGVIADQQGGGRVAVTTRHRIVGRFSDGSRQVFDEATPRMVQVGNRIKVIAGAAGTNG